MAARSGVVINMGSVQGLQSQGGIPAYAASKGAILSLTRQMAIDYAPYGLRVVAVNPGTIRTPLVEALLSARHGGDTVAAWEAAARAYPMKRVGEIRDIAEACLWLASERAGFVTGESLTIDGGIMARGGWAEAA
eukprot:1300109-Prymnesium_polylepis.2